MGYGRAEMGPGLEPWLSGSVAGDLSGEGESSVTLRLGGCQEEQPGCRDGLCQHLWKPLHLEGQPPKAPTSSGLSVEGGSGAVTSLRPGKQKGRETEHPCP